ncbi:MAG TPA: hypothetical protein VFR87_09205 [Nocardioidaceae bacterium]|nr:hypothetical protein [Nocardioidaceae bacterium]
MQRMRTTLAGLPIAAVLLASCANTTSDAYVVENDPGHVEHVDGSDLGRVHLTPAAVKRLQIDTTLVRRAGESLVVRDEAMFVDPDGAWWVYTNPAPGVYVRHEVSLAGHRGDLALLTSGPKPGTEVVTVGVAELYGIEAEVGH